MLLLDHLAAAIFICASLVVCHSKKVRISGARSHSPRSQSQEINWTQFFVYTRKFPAAASFPETIKNHDVACLYAHLNQHPENQYLYDELCLHLDGNAFKSIFSFVLQDEDAVEARQNLLLSPACIAAIPDHSWSLATKRLAQLTNIGLHVLPSKSIAQLTPKVFEVMVRKLHARQKESGSNYSGWSVHLTPGHFDPDNWTGDLWHLLTAESIGAIQKPRVQKAAISIVIGHGMRIPDGGFGIRESEIIDHGLRLIRLRSIQKHLGRIQSVKGMMEFIDLKVGALQTEAAELLRRNVEMTEKKAPSIKMKRRIDLLSLIGMFSKIGSASKDALSAVQDFMGSFGNDKKAAVTWEILSKFIVKNTDVGMVNFIGAKIHECSAEDLPIDSLVTEACMTRSIKVLLTIIQNARCAEMVGRIANIVDMHRQSLGRQYGMVKEAIQEQS